MNGGEEQAIAKVCAIPIWPPPSSSVHGRRGLSSMVPPIASA